MRAPADHPPGTGWNTQMLLLLLRFLFLITECGSGQEEMFLGHTEPGQLMTHGLY